MFNRFARIPGNRRTAPLLLVVGHHQPWTIAPDSLLNWTGRASRSAGGCPTRICTGAPRAHPIANTAAAPETEELQPPRIDVFCSRVRIWTIGHSTRKIDR